MRERWKESMLQLQKGDKMIRGTSIQVDEVLQMKAR